MTFELPRPLSHSSISMYNECPQKYKFKYIDKIPEKPRHFFSFGQSVHLALEFFYGVTLPPAPTLEQVLAHYEKSWVSAGYKDKAQEQEYFEDGKAMITAFYEKHIKDFAVPFFVEYGFNFSVDGVPVTGKVDRIDKLPDGKLAILDYKTGKQLKGGRVEEDAQLTMYQLACETLLGAEVARLSFYHVPSLKEQVVERHGEKLVTGLKKKIVATAEGITKGAFAPAPDESKCRWCDYKPICPIFKHQFPQSAPVEPEHDLAALVDKFGELQERSDALKEELEAVKEKLIAALRQKGYVRAFGKRFEVSRAASEKWAFSDKKKVLELLKKAGLYDRVLAPSAPKVEALMSDAQLDLDLKARLTELGERVESSELKVRHL